MASDQVKQEPKLLSLTSPKPFKAEAAAAAPVTVIDLDSSDSEDESGRKRPASPAADEGSGKKQRLEDFQMVVPLGFLDPLSPEEEEPEPLPLPLEEASPVREVAAALESSVVKPSKQFWKAGDYEGDGSAHASSASFSAGLDHVRVHPRFLHSNATSHKWALGAFAELLDNALDEVRNGAKHVKIDMVENRKDKSKMLLIEDDGGGMDPDKMRQCMSLGYSAKSKLANTIGQYGNGFKTSTMRLGADVVVFSRSPGKDGRRSTQSIGLLSYTFLRSTGKEDIIVPMIDYEKEGKAWKKIIRSSMMDWSKNVETIFQWSPFFNEDDLLQQFTSLKDQGTRIIIYNLWEDDQGELELDFSADKYDIQIRGVNRDDKKIQMAKEFPNSRHFLTYRHSLRSYASILYLRLPPGFRIHLRGKEVLHHNLVDDIMLSQKITYKPQSGADGVSKDMFAEVTIGFVKDAKSHIDVQGFNVYHKNRLIKPFWRVWNAAGSDGRGVIGVLEANFVEPAHDKQGFERTTVLQRLETRLIQMQKNYWSSYCHKIGYAPRRNKFRNSPAKGSGESGGKSASPVPNNVRSSSKQGNGSNGVAQRKSASKSEKDLISSETSEDESEEYSHAPSKSSNIKSSRRERPSTNFEGDKTDSRTPPKDTKATHSRNEDSLSNFEVKSLKQMEAENCELKDRLKKMEELKLELQSQRDRNKNLEGQIRELEQKLEEANKEQEALIDIFSDERNRRDGEEENLRKKLKDASTTIQDLLAKVRS